MVAAFAALECILVISNVDSPLKIDPAKQAYAGAVTSWALAIEPATSNPTPSPKPKPGDPCSGCDGKGKVGDGAVSRTCKECNGTGKVPGDNNDDDDTGATPEDQGSSPGDTPMTPQADAATSLDCSDGSCGTVRTRRGIFGGLFRRR